MDEGNNAGYDNGKRRRGTLDLKYIGIKLGSRQDS